MSKEDAAYDFEVWFQKLWEERGGCLPSWTKQDLRAAYLEGHEKGVKHGLERADRSHLDL